jgi:hypothetical protein
MACAAGKMLHGTGLRMLQIECTGMKTPILGVCDRRLATRMEACLAKLPPCEAPFTQHFWRSLLQKNIWMTPHVEKPPMKSAVLFGWEDRNGLFPVYFKGQMSSDSRMMWNHIL